ncbi:MAG: hypothetical protein HYX89_05570 [Chloroflexi bacterium]|nr:hypothetical protein [Chloroflexota bacterium]
MNQKMVAYSARNLERSMRLLTEIITILAGLAFAIAPTQFLVEPQTFTVRPLVDISGVEVWLFVVVMTTLIRFYHGNLRHLTENYSAETLTRRRTQSGQLFIDFMFLFIQSVLLVAISFFERTPDYLYWAFISLFAIDVVWFLLLGLATRSLSLSYAQTRWLLANIVTTIVLLLMANVILNIEVGKLVFSAVILTNCAVDYYLNWNFYFPRIFNEPMVVFFAAPLTNKILSGTIDPAFRAELESLIEAVKGLGFNVLNSHVREKWGHATPLPRELAAKAYADLLASDVVVAYIDETPSFGTHLEVGWASALTKPTIVAIKNNGITTPLVAGLEDAFPVYQIRFENREDLWSKLETQLIRIREGLK